jgi:outer membrane protein TolC
MSRVFGGILCVMLATSAHAQGPVRESEFLSVLQRDHPALASLNERVGIARAERTRAALLANPTASYEREAPGSTEQITWQLAWTPPLDGRRGAATRAADAGLHAATSQLEFDCLTLRSEMRQAFAEWSISSERSQVLDLHLALVRRLATQMESRASRGEESQLAARRLALAALEVEAEAALSEASAVRARAVAFSLHRGLSVGSQPERPPLPEVLDSLRATTRSDLEARRYEVEQAEWQLRHGGRFLQFPELAFGWQQVRDDTFSDEGPRVAVSWPLPLFDRQQPQRIEASARLAATSGRLQLATARAEAELSASRASYERLRQSALLGVQTVTDSERTVESATATFRLGESRLTDLLETLRSILSARLAALDLYAAALEAHRNLELAAGRPLSTEER